MTALADPHTDTLSEQGAEFETEVIVTDKQYDADGVAVVTLQTPDGSPLPRWTAGAHIDVLLGLAVTRQYSLCGDPTDLDRWRIGVLRDPAGSGSSVFVHDELQTGDTIRVRGPRNNFALATAPNYLFIAGGIGITPLLPMIREAEAAGATWRLAYGGRERASMAFLDEVQVHGERVLVHPHDERGLLPLAELLTEPQLDTLVYCCGPEPLLEAVEELCATWPTGALHLERFTPKSVGEPVRAEAFDIVLEESGLTLTVPSGRSILSVVEEAGISVLTSCEQGTCGTCETGVLDGKPDHRDSVLSDSEREANDCMMICVSRACSARLVLDL